MTFAKNSLRQYFYEIATTYVERKLHQAIYLPDPEPKNSFCRDRALQMASLIRLANIAAENDVSTIKRLLYAPVFGGIYQLQGYLCLDNVLTVGDRASCYGILVSTPDRAIVALRGSKNVNDWLFNFLVNANSNDIHSGISYLTDKLWQPIVSFLQKNAARQVLLAGHSLGGAIITLVAYQLQREYHNLKMEAAYTFGSPPVSCRKLDVGNNFFRMRSPRDIVPHIFQILRGLKGAVSLAAVLPEYQHSGIELLIGEDYQILPAQQDDENILQRLEIALKAMKFLTKIRGLTDVTEALVGEIGREHQMVRYIELLNHGSIPRELNN
jgi:hypothetical protein